MDSVHISGFYPPMASKIQYTDKFIYYEAINCRGSKRGLLPLQLSRKSRCVRKCHEREACIRERRWLVLEVVDDGGDHADVLHIGLARIEVADGELTLVGGLDFVEG